MNAESRQLLRSIRVLTSIVIAGLIASGLTAFPLLHEVDILRRASSAGFFPTSVAAWIEKVHEGLHVTYGAYPFIPYGTDWLAFGHLIIALFFVGVFLDPVRNAWLVRAGKMACLLVIPAALICGEIRGIPLWWRAIDCAFGIGGFIPLWFAGRLIRRLANSNLVAARSLRID
jgi:hypothetical protein